MAQTLLSENKSTIGRSAVASMGLEWHRLQLLLEASVSPGLAERTAARWFLTPRRRSRPDTESALLSRARAFRVEGLAAWRWGSGPPVLLVHGWEGRGAQLGAMVPPLVERGFSVVAFDAPGHGASAGFRSNVGEFADAVAAVGGRLGEPRLIVGHSLGAIASLLAVRRGAVTKGLVLVSPPSPKEALAVFRDALDVPESIMAGMRSRVERAVGATFDEVEGANLARDLPIPGLIFHDVRDREASVRIGQQIARAWPRATLHTTEGLGHRRILNDSQVVEQVAAFAGKAA
jgi:pimeloyl-ACP methyl ester carboxylesterase